ncbi:Nucleoside_transporter [Hexamita inflata]|uniref:Nucleoside transporter n=1 Tax=Hexamita inflata TaxID=28002 RepID=A0AA86PL84_9EUKA|nr:Nucleoside transporter [Hexamita inflata]
MKYETKLYYYFTLFGFNAILSYYCIIGQTNYWLQFYDNTILTVLSMVFCIGELLASFIAIYLNDKWSPRTFCMIHLLTNIICLAVLIPMKYIPNNTARTAVSCIPVFIAGVTASVFFASVVGVASKTRTILIQAVTMGISVSSIVMTLIQLALTAIFKATSFSYNNQLLYNCIVFYLIAIVTFTYCIFAWFKLEKLLPTANHLVQNEVKEEVKNDPQSVLDNESVNVSKLEESKTQTQQVELQQFETEPKENIIISTEKEEQTEGEPLPKKQFMKAVLPTSFALGMNNMITYSMFPLFVTNVQCITSIKKSKSTKPNDWWNLAFLTIQMAFDLVGKIIPTIKCIQKISLKAGIAMCYMRMVFWVLFPLITLPKPVVDLGVVIQLPIIAIDAISIIIEIFFTFSSSFVLTMCMMKYQENFNCNSDRQKASFYQNIIYQVGLSAGSILGTCMQSIFK